MEEIKFNSPSLAMDIKKAEEFFVINTEKMNECSNDIKNLDKKLSEFYLGGIFEVHYEKVDYEGNDQIESFILRWNPLKSKINYVTEKFERPLIECPRHIRFNVWERGALSHFVLCLLESYKNQGLTC